MRFVQFLLAFSFLSLGVFAQKSLSGPLRTGDILFQNLDCGDLCDAIEKVTKSYGGRQLSHIGLVEIIDDNIYVLEAIGDRVQRTRLSKFSSRSNNEILVGRIKKRYNDIIPKAITFVIQKLNVPYDDVFLYDNNKYYCSELLYDAFKAANSDDDFFSLQPMTFKQPGSETYFPVWVDYYKKRNMDIPEGAPGINPGGISMSRKLDVYVYRK
ncbi:MAG: YiiX/YebB-like N1pC/P60 family cysteine hydrolase [Chitinophagaceae bacterium]